MSQPQFGFVVERKGDTPSLFRQVHGNALVEIESEADRKRLFADPPEADGAWTMNRGIELHVFTADCLPVLLITADGKLAAAHAGWRGAMNGIVARAARRLGNPERLRAIFGPAILSCCFEVRDDFVAAFHQAGRRIDPYLAKRDGKLFCDLPGFVAKEELGLPEENLDLSALRCTYCTGLKNGKPELPSYRRNGSTEIRLRSWIRG